MMLRNWLVWILSKKLIEGLRSLPKHLCSNIYPFVYTKIRHVDVRNRLNVRQHDGFVVKNYGNFRHYVGI